MGANEAVRTAPHRLPEAVLRLGVSSIGTAPRFEGLGSKIVITGVSSTLMNNAAEITLVYDTKTAKLDIGRPLPERLVSSYRAASTGEKLCVIEAIGKSPLYLSEEPAECAALLSGPYTNFDDEDSIMSSLRGQMKEWAWKRGPLPLPPMHGRVKSYAVHPDGRTIFASSSFTFCLNTRSNGSSRCGDWCLPFDGRAYYDHDLDAWVGMRRSDNIDGGNWGTYYLCACDVPSALADGTTPPPAWKMSKKELTFFEPPPTSISRRTLVHTGRGRFCLVELTPAPPLDSHCICFQDGLQHLLRVTMFRAKHGKNGEHVVTSCRPGRSYLVPNYYKHAITNIVLDHADEPPTAFWM
ncbi:unnamed protein product [Alopecurus aequalis]